MSKRLTNAALGFFLIFIPTVAPVVLAQQNSAIARILGGTGRPNSALNSTARPRVISPPPAATGSRFCIKSTLSAVAVTRGLPAENLHFESLSANEMRQVRKELYALIAQGVLPSFDGAQGKLYADFLYVKKLAAEGRYRELLTVTTEAQRRPSWRNNYLNDITVDTDEAHTYFRTNTLQKLIRLAEYEAKVHRMYENLALKPSLIGSSASRETVKLFVEYLDHKPAFDTIDHILGAGGKYFDKSIFEDHVTDLAYGLKDLKPWERRSALDAYPEIAGIAVTEQNIDIYFGTKQMYVLRVESGSRKTRLFDESEAGRLFAEYCKTQIEANSTEAMRLVNVVQVNGTYRLSFPDGDIAITRAEFDLLKTGQPLPDTHPLSTKMQAKNASIVVWSNPLMAKSGGALDQAESFIHAVERAYSNSAIFRDDFQKDQTESKATSLRSFQVSGPQDIVAVIDQNSLVQDGNIINNISDDLSQANIKVVKYVPGLKWQGGEGKGLIVITGHINEALAQFIRQLGEAGYFKGNYVLLNSCHTKLTSQMVSEINERFGAVATLQHKDKIRPVDVENFLVDFAGKVTQPGDFWSKVLRSLGSNNLSGVWVICRNNNDRFRSGPPSNISGLSDYSSNFLS